MSKHTAGPWILNPYMGRQYNIRPVIGTGRSGGYGPIAKVVGDVRIVDAETRLANALLIAAAPELLAALEGILYHFVPEQGNLKVEQEMIKAAHAAIAKAKGG